MYFQFDTIQFEGLFGPSAIGYRKVSRVARTPLINGKEVLLHVGNQLDEYKLDFRLHFQFVNVQNAIDELEERKNDARVCPFTDGDGVFIGNFVITALEVIETQRNPGGALVAANLRMTLLEYVQIAANEPELQNAIDSAEAVVENGVTPVRIDQLPTPDPVSLVNNLTEQRAEALAIVDASNIAVQAPVSERQQFLAKIQAGSRRVSSQVQEAVQLMATVQNFVAQGPLLLQQIQDSGDLAQALGEAARRGDLNLVAALSQNLQANADSSFNLTRPLSRLIIFRRL
jgi:phage protein U